ncbi:hypothetical protein GCM10007159_40100 [Modicisalibacter luteus]|nr:hypothetical protein GCM10007159_40100 [Halomonas lutea]
MARQLDLQRKAEEGTYEYNKGQYADCFEGQTNCDGMNDVCGNEKFQAE